MDFETEADADSASAAEPITDRARTVDEPSATADVERGSAATKPAAARKPGAPRQQVTPRKPAPARKPAAPRTPAAPARGASADQAQDQREEQVGNADTPVVSPAPKTAQKPPAKPRATTALPAAQPLVTPDTPPVSTPGALRAPKKTPAQKKPAQPREKVLVIEQLRKSFGSVVAVAGIDLTVQAGSIFGIVGPNGAGKTTTLSMVTGLLRPDAGRILVHGADVWNDPVVAKRNMGVLPDRLRLFDRLTGAQLLHYSGVLRKLDRATVRSRSSDLAVAFGMEDALDRLVTDYSAGMMKKIALAAAMIHSPRVLILDEPFEAVDPVSAANVIEILQRYAEAGGTVVMSSHSMDLIQRICDSVAIIVRGAVLASGTMDEVRAGATLEDRFVELAGGRKAAEGMEWLHSFSD